jgi:Ca2+-transporting ATPase
MDRPPRSPQHNVFSEGRGMHMIWVGMLMAGITLSAQGWAINNDLHWQTIVFNILCLCQLGHVLPYALTGNRSLNREYFLINRSWVPL